MSKEECLDFHQGKDDQPPAGFIHIEKTKPSVVMLNFYQIVQNQKGTMTMRPSPRRQWYPDSSYPAYCAANQSRSGQTSRACTPISP